MTTHSTEWFSTIIAPRKCYNKKSPRISIPRLPGYLFCTISIPFLYHFLTSSIPQAYLLYTISLPFPYHFLTISLPFPYRFLTKSLPFVYLRGKQQVGLRYVYGKQRLSLLWGSIGAPVGAAAAPGRFQVDPARPVKTGWLTAIKTKEGVLFQDTSYLCTLLNIWLPP